MRARVSGSAAKHRKADPGDSKGILVRSKQGREQGLWDRALCRQRVQDSSVSEVCQQICTLTAPAALVLHLKDLGCKNSNTVSSLVCPLLVTG